MYRWLAIFLILACAGCAARAPQADPVDPGRARDALKLALDGWKGGKKPVDMKQASPAMTVVDFDWERGARLVDYKLVGEGTKDDANLRVPVELTIEETAGKTRQVQAAYLIGTHPSVTVFRDFPS